MIRQAVTQDVPSIIEMIRELADYEKALPEAKATEEQLREALFGAEPAVFAHIAEDASGETVGFALWFRNFSTWTGTHGIYLEDLYVRPAARGGGHGKALLTELARIAVERGYGRFEWSVLDWNEPSIGFYKSLGAEPMAEWTVFRLAGEALRSSVRRRAEANREWEIPPDVCHGSSPGPTMSHPRQVPGPRHPAADRGNVSADDPRPAPPSWVGTGTYRTTPQDSWGEAVEPSNRTCRGLGVTSTARHPGGEGVPDRRRSRSEDRQGLCRSPVARPGCLPLRAADGHGRPRGRLDFTLDEIEDLRIAVDEACAILLQQAVPGSVLSCEFRLVGDALRVTVSAPTTDGRAPERDTFAWTVLSALAGEVESTVAEDRTVSISLHKKRGGTILQP